MVEVYEKIDISEIKNLPEIMTFEGGFCIFSQKYPIRKSIGEREQGMWSVALWTWGDDMDKYSYVKQIISQSDHSENYSPKHQHLEI